MHIQHETFGSAHRCPVCGESHHVRTWVDPAIWSRGDMRLALVRHDIAAVYWLLQRYGVSQRKIAARTDQTQSEISEILKGRRVNGYDLLVRIAKGLGVPRGKMGLAYDTPDGEPPPA